MDAVNLQSTAEVVNVTRGFGFLWGLLEEGETEVIFSYSCGVESAFF